MARGRFHAITFSTFIVTCIALAGNRFYYFGLSCLQKIIRLIFDDLAELCKTGKCAIMEVYFNNY